MTAAAHVVGIDAVPGTLKPRAIATIAALFNASTRTLAVWQIAQRIGVETKNALQVFNLMQDMAELGLVERVGPAIRYSSRWRLLVEGPTAARAS